MRGDVLHPDFNEFLPFSDCQLTKLGQAERDGKIVLAHSRASLSSDWISEEKPTRAH